MEGGDKSPTGFTTKENNHKGIRTSKSFLAALVFSSFLNCILLSFFISWSAFCIVKIGNKNTTTTKTTTAGININKNIDGIFTSMDDRNFTKVVVRQVRGITKTPGTMIVEGDIETLANKNFTIYTDTNYTTMANRSFKLTSDEDTTTMSEDFTKLAEQNATLLADLNVTTMANRTSENSDTSSCLVWSTTGIVCCSVLLIGNVIVWICCRKRYSGFRDTKRSRKHKNNTSSCMTEVDVIPESDNTPNVPQVRYAKAVHSNKTENTSLKVQRVPPFDISTQASTSTERQPLQYTETVSRIRELSGGNDVTIQHELFQGTSDFTILNEVTQSSTGQSRNSENSEEGTATSAVQVSEKGAVEGNLVSAEEKAEDADVSKIDDHDRLDWNKLFMFLANIINPRTYKLLFIELFGYGQHLLPRGMDINSIIDHKEAGRKDHLPTLFFELFVTWRNLMGNAATPDMIREVLAVNGENYILEKFNEFMRNPPKIPVSPLDVAAPNILEQKPSLLFGNHETRGLLNAFNFSLPSPDVNVMALGSAFGPGCFNDVNNFSLYQNKESNEIAIRQTERKEVCLMKTRNKPNVSRRRYRDFRTYSYNESLPRRKRQLMFDRETTSSEDEIIPSKCLKQTKDSQIDISSRGTKRKIVKARKPQDLKFKQAEKEVKGKTVEATICKELVKREIINHENMIRLIKSLMQTNSIEVKEMDYNLFLDHTVTTLMKGTGETEEVISSLLIEDYENVQEYKTKRGNVTVLLDTDHTTLSLRSNEWECLQFYVENPRTQTVKRQLQRNVTYLDSRLVFIDYFGNPLLQKENVDAFELERNETGNGVTCNISTATQIKEDGDKRDMSTELINGQQKDKETLQEEGKTEDMEIAVSDKGRTILGNSGRVNTEDMNATNEEDEVSKFLNDKKADIVSKDDNEHDRGVDEVDGKNVNFIADNDLLKEDACENKTDKRVCNEELVATVEDGKKRRYPNDLTKHTNTSNNRQEDDEGVDDDRRICFLGGYDLGLIKTGNDVLAGQYSHQAGTNTINDERNNPVDDDTYDSIDGVEVNREGNVNEIDSKVGIEINGDCSFNERDSTVVIKINGDGSFNERDLTSENQKYTERKCATQKQTYTEFPNGDEDDIEFIPPRAVAAKMFGDRHFDESLSEVEDIEENDLDIDSLLLEIDNCINEST